MDLATLNVTKQQAALAVKSYRDRERAERLLDEIMRDDDAPHVDVIAVADVIRSEEAHEVRDFYILAFRRCELCERRALLGDILCRTCINGMAKRQTTQAA